MAYWSKITYEKSTYIIDLDTISAFSSELDNKRLTFWLPNSSQPIILNPQGNYEAYKQVLDYLKKTIDRNSRGSWIKINYDRKEFAIDMSRISSFACEQNGRLSFCLPDSATNIIILRQSNPDAYQEIQEFIKKTTGQSLP
ncbi:hypothetical protein QUA70_15785 [Microcoleus sp. LAD1_D5]|uniref:hypothetical protein n=1 Tax=unclassified Microcoleus TaxID=2642155 RepID=UPI002FCF7273